MRHGRFAIPTSKIDDRPIGVRIADELVFAMNISANWVPFLKQDTTTAPIIRTTQERAFVIYMVALSEWADIYDSRYEKFADELELSNRQPLLGSVLSLLNFHQRCVAELV